MTVPAEIVAAILAVRKDMKSIKKDEFNPHDRYDYVSIDRYYEQVATMASAAGLIWRAREKSFELVENQGGKKDRTYARAAFIYDLFVSGACSMDHMTITIFAPVAGAQTTGQLYSYADKVFMRTTFCVPSGEKDADATETEELRNRPATDPFPIPSVTQFTGLPLTVPSGIADLSMTTPTPQEDDLKPPSFLQRPVPGAFQRAPTHDADGVVYDSDLCPSYSDGLPVASVGAINAAAAETLYEIFRTFMPKIKSQAKLTQWHGENLPAFEAVEKINPTIHLKIKGLFRDKFEELRKD